MFQNVSYKCQYILIVSFNNESEIDNGNDKVNCITI